MAAQLQGRMGDGRRWTWRSLLVLAAGLMLITPHGEAAKLDNLVAVDDAEEDKTKDFVTDVGSNDLEIGARVEDNMICLRFADILIEKGAQITASSLTFTAKNGGGNDNPPPQLRIRAERKADSDAFQEVLNDLKSRQMTNSEIVFIEDREWSAQVKFDTPNFANVVAEIVNLDDWQPGNTINICLDKIQPVEGISFRRAFSAEAQDSQEGDAPRLNIEFFNPGDPDAPPPPVLDNNNDIDLGAIFAGLGGTGLIAGSVVLYRVRSKDKGNPDAAGSSRDATLRNETFRFGAFGGGSFNFRAISQVFSNSFGGGPFGSPQPSQSLPKSENGSNFGGSSSFGGSKFSGSSFFGGSKFGGSKFGGSSSFGGSRSSSFGGSNFGPPKPKAGDLSATRDATSAEVKVYVAPGPTAHLARTGKTGRGGFAAPYGAPRALTMKPPDK